jgi:hypothetical protein
MIEKLLANRKWRARLIIVLGLLCGAPIAWYGVQQGVSYKELIIVFAALIGAVIVFRGELGIRYGLVLWTLTLALGYRTIRYSENLAIHPAELLLLLLFACIFSQRKLVGSNRLALPLWLWLFIPFWVLGWWPAIFRDIAWDNMLNEFRNFMLLIPLMIVVSVVLQKHSYWRLLLLAFFLVSTWIAVMGVIESQFPTVTNLFPAFMTVQKPSLTEEGFVRAQFTFWGAITAIFICVMALPAGLVLSQWWPLRLPRALILVAAGFQIYAIYLAGYRSIWFLFALQLVVAASLSLRRRTAAVALICICIAAAGFILIPKPGNERIASGIRALQLQPTDSSGIDRKNRALNALNSAIDNPLGNGWNGSGWVHADFLQVAANLGLLAGIIFLGGYLHTLLRLGRRTLSELRAGEGENLGLSLLLMFIGAGGLLAMEGVQVLPQLALPVWFVWALVEAWLRQTSELRRADSAAWDISQGQVVNLNRPAFSK